jgi:hypothetical protein
MIHEIQNSILQRDENHPQSLFTVPPMKPMFGGQPVDRQWFLIYRCNISDYVTKLQQHSI